MISHMCKNAHISGAGKMNGIWQIRTPASILRIRLSGNVEKRIVNSRGDIRLSFSPLKT